MITSELVEDCLFASKVMSLAMAVAELDDDRIKTMINNTDPFGALGEDMDGIMPHFRATMAIMAFTVFQLRKVIPDMDQLRKLTDEYKKMVPPEFTEAIEKTLREAFDNEKK